ncbi:hypothetical protein [Couchioplanes caeruleus]|uniref:Uncharacterized protein n=2 Tax=Couchioplanes caeruleus TaxID=56438 RepID=A0A1K0FP03_9ACTN|nr:hypothetical protein [Couchioplanes caeruleus]OJF14521.1 hypothetical protein BG844_09305 [Couchioplanes caeruleus subsp. caeruleus]ROP21209.1 hypothetical protein EDD30_7603 [Couchioplanes caeruleus]
MLLDSRTTTYLHRAVTALTAGRLNGEQLSPVCPDCDTDVTQLPGFIFGHLLWRDAERETVTVLVGCEGYWTINPHLLDVNATNWRPRTAAHDTTRIGARDAEQ